MDAKRFTATALLEALCKTGWCIQSSAAQAVAETLLLSLANPTSSWRGALWALASALAGPQQEGDAQRKIQVLLCSALGMQ
jgi:hypothetical protein